MVRRLTRLASKPNRKTARNSATTWSRSVIETPPAFLHDQDPLLSAMGLESVFLSARPIVLSLARSTMPSSTTLFSNNRKVQRAYPLGGLEHARAISLASFS